MEYTLYCPPFGEVALRKESVDRNRVSSWWMTLTLQSLSARRAWIEIWGNYIVVKMSDVALRKESVDRNVLGLGGTVIGSWSLSARRAWIEIVSKSALMVFNAVALRK